VTERFPKSSRVLRRADFVRIQKSSARIGTKHFLLLLAPAGGAPVEGAPCSRFGVVASRKVGCAVVRNRAKRLLREAFRRHRELFPPGVDVVVIVRSGAAELKLAEVVVELSRVAPELARKGSKLTASAGRRGTKDPP
jgi:ribonuclease P protein component